LRAANYYWDTNGTGTASSGAATGTWGTSVFWSTDSTGANVGSPVLTATTGQADNLYFSAGTNFTGGTVTVLNTQLARTITFDDPVAITLSGGTAINLGNSATGSGLFFTANGANTISTPLILDSTATAIAITNSTTSLQTITAITGSAASGTQTLTASASGSGGIALNGVIADVAGSASKVALRVSSTGSGIVSLTNTNTYTGLTTVASGVLKLDSANALPGGIGTTGGIGALTFSGGVLGLGHGDFTRNVGNGTAGAYFFSSTSGGFAAYGANRVVNIGGAAATYGWGSSWFPTAFNGQRLVLGAPTATHKVTVVNPLHLFGSIRPLQVDRGLAAVDAELSGELSGDGGGINKSGNGVVIFSGVNTYNGPTLIQNGAVMIHSIKDVSGGSSSLGAPVATVNGQITLGSAATTGTLIYTGAAQSTNRTIQIGANSAIPAAGDTGGATLQNDGSGALTFSAATLNAAGTGVTASTARVLTLQGTNSGANRISGVIQNNTVGISGTGNVALTKSGTGTWVLTGANTYSGATTISAGTLQIGNGSTTGSIATTSGITNNATLVFNRSNDLTVDSVIGGSGNLTKQGAGILTLTAAPTYGGNTTVSVGTLSLNAPNLNNDGSTITLAAAARLNLNFSGTDSIANLFIDATPMAAGVYKSVGSPASGTAIAQILGTGTLTVIGYSAPTLVSVVDNAGGRPVAANSAVTYTLAFSTDMDATTVSAADFANAGTSTISIGTITEITPGVFSIQVTPTSAGTLRLQIPAGATLTDSLGNPMVTTSAIPDDTTLVAYQSDSLSPALRGISPVANNSGSILSIVMPSGVMPGDLLIANIAQNATSSGNPTAAGWTLVNGKTLGGSTSRYGAVLYKVATPGEAGPYNFTLTGSVPVASGVIMAFSSVDFTGGPFDTALGSIYTGNAATTAVGPAAQLTTASPAAQILMLGMAVSTNSATWSNWSTTSPGTLTELYDVQGSGTGNGATSLGAAWAFKPAAGATGTGSATLSASARNGSILLALRPSYNAALLTALTELKNHINGAITLSAAQINAHKLTIDAQKSRFGSSASAIAAALDLVATYDSVVGPLWVAQNGFTRATVTNDIPWTICTLMQHIIDLTYTAANIANHANLLDGFKFGSSAHFPGACAPPANPNQINTATINANFPNTWGWPMWDETPYATKPTGNYLAPGSIATITVPASMVGKGYQIRVGCHTGNLTNRPTLLRLDRVSLLYPINSTVTRVAHPLGGGIYIAVPAYVTNVGIVNIQIANAVRSPYFSAKTFHTTTPAQWLEERANPAPWADFQSEKYMMQVPSSWISSMPDPTQLMKDWDIAADTCNDLMGFPREQGKETMYDQVDINLRASVYQPGYPTANNTYSPTTLYNGNVNSYLLRGPQFAPYFHFHEHGHGYFISLLPGEIESVVNLLHVAVWNQRFGYSIDDAFRASLSGTRAYATVDTTALAWMMCDNFVSGTAMQQNEKEYQLKGHAKFVDVARIFGWEKLNQYNYSFTNDYEVNGTRGSNNVDSHLLRMAKSVGADIRPLFDFWGVPPLNNSTLGAAIAAANLQPSAAIYNKLVYYKSLIPTDNAAFRTFASNWWGRQPLLTGGAEESSHAARWDNYNPSTAAATAARAQAIINLYFPNGNPAPPPTLETSAIIDDKGGSPIALNTLVTYTLTFSRDMDASSVSAADFGNAGTASVNFGTVSETTPGVFSVQATPTSVGSLQLRVNAGAVLMDTAGIALDTTNSITDDTVITVNGANVAPVWTSNPINGVNATKASAYAATLADNASDANGNPLAFAKVSGPAWLSVASNGTLTGTPTNDDVGANVFTVSVSDGIAAPVLATLNITVINTNDAPIWNSNPVESADAIEGAAYSASLAGSATDVDAGSNLTYAKQTGPAWLSVASDGTLSGIPTNNDVGTNNFTVSVSDGIAAPVLAILHITVINTNDAPAWNSDPVAGADATDGTAYIATLAGSATDVDAGSILTFAKVSGPAWLSVAVNGTLSGIPTNNDVGANVFTVSVSDGIAPPVSTTLTITVTIQANTYTWTGTTAATYTWAAGTSWDAAPISGLDAILRYPSTLAAGVVITSNNDVAAPPFQLNQLRFTNVGPGTGTAPTLTLTGNQLEFITNTALATPTLVLNTTGTVNPTIDVQNPLLLTNNLGVTATTHGKLSGVLSGGGSLTKTGSGSLTLTGANTFSGGLFLNGGSVQNGEGGAGGGDHLGAANSVITVNSAGTIQVQSGGNFSSTTLNKSIVLNASLSFGGGGGATITGAVTGTGGITPIPAGASTARILTLQSLNNTFTGAIGAAQASNIIVNSLSDASGSGNISLGVSAGGSRFSWGTGATTALILNNRAFALTSTTGGDIYSENANANNTLTVNSNLVVSGGSKTLTLGGTNTGANTFAGIIADGVSSVISVAKANAGTWILSGVNTYTGTTLINDGTLKIGGSGTLGGGGYAGAISIATGKTFQYSSSAEQVLAGIISGGGTLIKDTGGGTLTLSGANSYMGGTTVTAGNLNLASSGSQSATGTVTVSGGGTLTIGADTGGRTFANSMVLNGGTVRGGQDNVGSGGTIIVDGNGVTHLFTASGSLFVPVAVTANQLIVGAGGGGGGGTSGSFYNAGGGGGQVTNLPAQALSAGITPVTVGIGGAGANNLDGSNGGASSIGSNTASGGLGAKKTPTSGTGGTSGSGKTGGSRSVQGAGGGGGDFANGGSATSSNAGGAGGAGSANTSIEGLTAYGQSSAGSAYFGGGGGAAGMNSSATSGLGGGGTGGNNGAGSVGTANTGGGGGAGAAGGSGIAVVQYAYGLTAGTVTLSGLSDLRSASTLDAYGFGGLIDVTNVISTSTGSGGLTIASSASAGGVVRLGSSNTYLGNTTINSSAILRLNAVNAMPFGTGKGNVAVSGRLDLNGQSTQINGLSGTGIVDSTSGTPTLIVGNNDASSSFGGVIQNTAGTLALTKAGAGTLVLNSANTYTGNTTVSAGTLTLETTSETAFVLNGSTSNKITGAGTATIKGKFNINTAAALTTSGTTWTLVDVATRTFDLAFSVTGFTEINDVWTRTEGSDIWEFKEATGILTLNPSGVTNPYTTWSGGAPFGADANFDGVTNGLAFLLGAASPTANATGLLPKVTQSGGNLELTFTCLKVGNRGGAALTLENSNNLVVWSSVAVPDTASTNSGVVFTVPTVNADSNLVDLKAVIPSTQSASGKLFGRLKAISAP